MAANDKCGHANISAAAAYIELPRSNKRTAALLNRVLVVSHSTTTVFHYHHHCKVNFSQTKNIKSRGFFTLKIISETKDGAILI